MRRPWLILQCLAALTSITVVASANDAGCDAVSYRLTGAASDAGVPPNSDGPTLVDLGLFIIDVTDIDEVAGTFTVEGFLDLVWCDPRLASDPEAPGADPQILLTADATRRLEQIWWPDVQIANSTSGRDVNKQVLKLSTDGTVEYEERFSAEIEAIYDLRRFPFDRQVLPIVIESFAWSGESLRFHEEGDKVSFSNEFEMAEWHTTAVRTRIESNQEIRDRAPFSRLVLEIEVSRQAVYYIWKILIPLVLLVAASWSVFWMDEESLAERMGVSFTGILAVVAYQFIIDDDLPQVSYLTFMDAVLFASFAVMMGTVVQNVVVRAPTGASRRLSEEWICRLDRACRWLFPAIYGVWLGVLALAYH